MTRAEVIAQRRREQPIAELERKARKAARRGSFRRLQFGNSQEGADWCFAHWHEWDLQQRAKFLAEHGPERAFCHSCHGFGTDFDDEAKRYRGPVQHKPRCYYADVPPRVYPGTTFTGAGPGPKGRLP